MQYPQVLNFEHVAVKLAYRGGAPHVRKYDLHLSVTGTIPTQY